MEETLFYGCALLCEGKAILIEGPSGSGKSDLTLRFLWQFAPHLFADSVRDKHSKPIEFQSTEKQYGFISDDQVVLRCQNAQLLASAPVTIKGLLEIRGIGIINISHITESPVSLILVLTSSNIPRFIDKAPKFKLVLGVRIPVIALNPFEQSALLKIKIAQDLYGI